MSSGSINIGVGGGGADGVAGGDLGGVYPNPIVTSVAHVVSGILPVADGGTNSNATLNNNRILVSSGDKMVENAALTASSPLRTDGSGLPTIGSTSLANEVVGQLPLSQTSGSLSLTSQVSGVLPLSQTSGSISLSLQVSGTLPLSQTSGSISLTTQVVNNLPLSQTSGSISLTAQVSGTLPAANVSTLVGVDIISSVGSTTYTKDPLARSMLIEVISGGCGGGGGSSTALGTQCAGGGGGGPGLVVQAWVDAADMKTICSVTIGAGGPGGASTSSGNGNAGANGSQSSIGINNGFNLLAPANSGAIAQGGSSAQASRNGTGGATSLQTKFPYGCPTGGISTSGSLALDPNIGVYHPGPGGGASGLSAGAVLGTPANGSRFTRFEWNDLATVSSATMGGGGAAGTTASGSSNGVAGAAGPYPAFGQGGGGGVGATGSSTFIAGAGGAGGTPGGGGGGGGSCANGFASGAGGNGARGEIRIWKYS